jgi:hypothetical protein
VNAKLVASCLASATSPASVIRSSAASAASRPPARRRNSEDDKLIVAVGSPSSYGTTLARPAVSTRSSRSIGPVKLIRIALPSGARPRLPMM